jgi:Fur family transcriptional regulator, ferric uptake regulator
MKKSIYIDTETILHDAGFKVTTVRTALLEALNEAHKPLSAAQLIKKVRKTHADTATVYRALNAFVEKDLVRALSLEKEKVVYQLMVGKPHSHHVVCTECSTIETIPFCVRSIETNAKERSKLFKTISGHTLSFLGTCKKCARAVR